MRQRRAAAPLSFRRGPSDPVHTTTLLLQSFRSVDAALKHLYVHSGRAADPCAYLLNRSGRHRTALGALDGVLHTLVRLPGGTTAPASPSADGLPGLPAAPTGETHEPTHVEVPAAMQQKQKQQQQQEVTAAPEAGDMYVEAVVRDWWPGERALTHKGKQARRWALGR